jgi:predicted adenine nucleotide alpha hydrolase (AANH) superfamily ATPase
MRDGVERCMKCWVRKEDTALSLMNTGYTEVFDGSLELAVTKDSEEVPDKEESDADDTLF